ncbi:MAG TPA: hypothetical protein VMW17_22380 [Candidatus Binatia bacterium]|nr:hypothetical protein [Candidatus Binatia bacterium]
MVRTPSRCAIIVGLLIVASVSRAARAATPCVGDCDDSGTVTVDELVLGVNIALGNLPVDRCTAFDRDDSRTVSVDELVAGVNNALNGCVGGATPTPTQTASATLTPTPPPGCGNGVVDFDLGETCDDGNTMDGDSCPANCRIASCTATDTEFIVHVDFTPPAGVDVAGVTAFVRYPDGVVRIPGSGNDQQVQDRISALPDNSFSTANDLDYALRVALLTTDQSPIPPGRLFTITFDTCVGAALPTTADFYCKVDNSADPQGQPVQGTTCRVTFE